MSKPILRSSETLLFASVTIPDVTRSEINDSSISTANVFMGQPLAISSLVPPFCSVLFFPLSPLRSTFVLIPSSR